MDLVLLGLIISLAFSAFFSGMEIAFFSANRLAIELGKEGSRSGRILSFLAGNPSNFIGTLLIGNNIALVIFGLLAAQRLEPWLETTVGNEFLILLVQTLITTAVVLIFGEFLPKTLFRLYPLGILGFFAIPLLVLYYALYLPVVGTVQLARGVLKLLRVDMQEETADYTRVDLVHFLEQGSDPDDDGAIDTELIENALDFREVKVRECMIPRPEIAAVGINTTIHDLRNLFVETGYSRLPVYFQSLDNVLGYVHHFDILSKPKNIGSIIMTLPVVPETMMAQDLLNLFRKDKKTMAWVVDEFGGTSGVVTMEDVLEELFGEIKDEHDDPDLLERQISEDVYEFSARLEVDYLNDKFGLGIPEGEYETLAGYVVSSTESIPEEGDHVIVDRFSFDIIKASNKRIETMRLKVLAED